MPHALVCDCGARFELDDLLVGQEIRCPECGNPVRAPAQAPQVRTSLWAITALAVSLIGAFTFVGGLVAALIGLYALVVLRQHKGQLAGKGYAITAILIGLIGSAATGAVMARPDLLPVATWVRQLSLGGQIDTTGALEVVSRGGDVLLTRPSRDWGRAARDRTDDPAVGDIQQKCDLLLVNIRRYAYVDVIRNTTSTHRLDDFEQTLREEINPHRGPIIGDDTGAFGRGGGGAEGLFPLDFRQFAPGQTARARFDVEGYKGKEWLVHQQRGGKKWVFLIRVYRRSTPRPGDPFFIVRAYTPLSRLAANEEEMTRILDSIRIPE